MLSRRRALSASLWLSALDAACLMLSIVVGVKLVVWLNSIEPFRIWMAGKFGIWLDPVMETSIAEYVVGHVGGWIYFCGSVVFANYVVGSYGIRISISRFNLLVNWIFSLFVALLVLSVTSYALFRHLLGRGVLAAAVVSYATFSLVVKAVLYGFVLRRKPFIHRVALIGTGVQACETRVLLEEKHVLPAHSVCAYIKPAGEGTDVGGGDVIGDIIDRSGVIDVSEDSIEGVIASLEVDLVVTCLDDKSLAERYQLALRRIRFAGTEVIDAMTAAEIYGGKVPLSLVSDTWLLQASKQPSIAVVTRFKRMFNVFTSVVSCVVYVPLGLIVALLVKLGAPHMPVIYVQERVGKFGKLFTLYKFRTMIEGAEDSVGAVWAEKDDPRITRLGRVLRRFRLDEIPQMWNILRGDMSIVGPRPERPELVAKLEKEIPYYRERENVMPGLTGWAQVQYPYTDNIEDTARKLEFDLYYTKNLSMSLDLQIILRTLRIILFAKERSV